MDSEQRQSLFFATIQTNSTLKMSLVFASNSLGLRTETTDLVNTKQGESRDDSPFDNEET